MDFRSCKRRPVARVDVRLAAQKKREHQQRGRIAERRDQADVRARHRDRAYHCKQAGRNRRLSNSTAETGKDKRAGLLKFPTYHALCLISRCHLALAGKRLRNCLLALRAMAV